MKLTFRSPGNPLREADVLELESRLGFPLPSDYRQFLQEINGGEQPDREVFTIDNGQRAFLKELYSLKSGRMFELEEQINDRHAAGILPKHIIPIGLDCFGNDVCLDIGIENFGEVCFHYHDRGKAEADDEFEPTYLVARNFTNFLVSLKFDPGKTSNDEIELMGQTGKRADLINFISRGNSIEKINKYSRTIAQEAARHGNLTLLQVCREHSASLRRTIHLAAMNGHSDVVDYVLGQGIDINERDKDGKTALVRAQFRHKGLAENLRERGATE